MNGYYIIYLSFIDNLQYINNTTLGCQVVKKKKKKKFPAITILLVQELQMLIGHY